jgi:hypothetical protein
VAHAARGFFEKGESLAGAFQDGRDQPAPRRSWSISGGGDIGAGRRDADPAVGGVRGVTESAVAVKEDRVAVAGPLQVLAGEDS